MTPARARTRTTRSALTIRPPRLHSLNTNIHKKYNLVKKNKEINKIREVDSVHVHENEALVKGNRKKKKKRKEKK